jgi:hypothetical protein
MAGPFDLTGQNIENTYQRVLQTPDGVNIYDGTGSLFTVTAVAAPAGPYQSIQFNDNGVTSGSGLFTFNKNTNTVNLTGSLIATSFTGSLFGTASWAYSASQALTASFVKTAQTASYVSSSNVYGPNGFDSINYATSAGSAGSAAIATNVTSPLVQNLIVDGKFTTQLNNTNLSTLAQNLHYYTGHTIYGPKGGGVSIGDLVYLETDNVWYQVDQTTDSSTKMLGIWVDDVTGYVLLEGDIVLDASYITSPNYGLPLFISGSARFTSRPENLSSGYIRAVGHPYYYYNDGFTIYNWILRFKPSNDWTQR